MMLSAEEGDGLVAMCPLFAKRRYLPLISDLRFVLAPSQARPTLNPACHPRRALP